MMLPPGDVSACCASAQKEHGQLRTAKSCLLRTVAIQHNTLGVIRDVIGSNGRVV